MRALFCHAPPRARIYEFASQLSIGHLGERAVDQTIGPLFDIRPVCRELDYDLGVDRIWYDPTGLELWAQYKVDCAAHRTGRVFLELALRNSRADLFAFLAPGLRKLYVFVADAILSNLGEWTRHYGERMVANRGYTSPGVPVPLSDLLPLAWYVLPVDEADLPCHECAWSMPRDAA